MILVAAGLALRADAAVPPMLLVARDAAHEAAAAVELMIDVALGETKLTQAAVSPLMALVALDLAYFANAANPIMLARALRPLALWFGKRPFEQGASNVRPLRDLKTNEGQNHNRSDYEGGQCTKGPGDDPKEYAAILKERLHRKLT